MAEINFDHFLAVDIRVGTVIKAEPFPRVPRKEVRRLAVPWEHLDVAATVHQAAHDALLDTQVEQRHTVLPSFACLTGLRHTDLAGQLHALHRRHICELGLEFLDGRAVAGHHGVHGAILANVRHQGARVHIPNAHDFISLQIVLKGAIAAWTACNGREVAHHHARHARSRRLGFVLVHTVVADVGRGHHHNLTMVTGICEDLLVAIHPRVEGDFTKTCPTASRRFALKYGAVCQDEHCRVFW